MAESKKDPNGVPTHPEKPIIFGEDIVGRLYLNGQSLFWSNWLYPDGTYPHFVWLSRWDTSRFKDGEWKLELEESGPSRWGREEVTTWLEEVDEDFLADALRLENA